MNHIGWCGCLNQMAAKKVLDQTLHFIAVSKSSQTSHFKIYNLSHKTCLCMIQWCFEICLIITQDVSKHLHFSQPLMKLHLSTFKPVYSRRMQSLTVITDFIILLEISSPVEQPCMKHMSMTLVICKLSSMPHTKTTCSAISAKSAPSSRKENISKLLPYFRTDYWHC